MKTWIKNLSFLLLGVLCSGFSRANQDLLIDQIINQYCKKWKQSGFNCFGSGGAQMYEIKTICLSFTKQDALPSIENRREIIIQMVDDLMLQVNSCRALRPYLSEYPFRAANCLIGVGFENSKQEECKVYNVGRKICYYTGLNEEKQEETYEQAKEIVGTTKTQDSKNNET